MAKTYVLKVNGEQRKALLGDVIGGSGFWKWTVNEPKTFTVTAPIYKGAPFSKSGITTAPDLIDVVDVADGKAKRLLGQKVLVSTLLENFPEDSYVGKTFQAIQLPPPEGKRYKQFELRLVDLEAPAEESAGEDDKPKSKKK
jgi:hypothetical protein